MAIGNAAQTYQTAGITSDLSRSRQNGPLQLLTTDASGNLASDQGDVFKKIARMDAGIAMAMSMQVPSLTTDENFGLRAGYGAFDGAATAMGLSAIGVLCRDCFVQSDRIALDVAAAVGNSSFYAQDSGAVTAIRVGAQWTWK